MMTMGNYLDENGDFYLTKNTASESLAKLAQELQAAVEAFKL